MSTKSKISNDGTRMEFDYQTLSYTVSNVKLRSFKLRAFSNIICWPTSQLKEKCKHHTDKKGSGGRGEENELSGTRPLATPYQRASLGVFRAGFAKQRPRGWLRLAMVRIGLIVERSPVVGCAVAASDGGSWVRFRWPGRLLGSCSVHNQHHAWLGGRASSLLHFSQNHLRLVPSSRRRSSSASIGHSTAPQSKLRGSGRPYCTDPVGGAFYTNTVTNVLDRSTNTHMEEQAPAAMEEDQPVSCESF